MLVLDLYIPFDFCAIEIAPVWFEQDTCSGIQGISEERGEGGDLFIDVPHQSGGNAISNRVH